MKVTIRSAKKLSNRYILVPLVYCIAILSLLTVAFFVVPDIAFPEDTSTVTTTPCASSTISDEFCGAECIYDVDAMELEYLRYFRDNVLACSPLGRELIQFYYTVSPNICQTVKAFEELKEEAIDLLEGIIDML